MQLVDLNPEHYNRLFGEFSGKVQARPILCIAHDLTVVVHMNDGIAVMYLGKVVEIGRATEVACLQGTPTRKLSSRAVPVADTDVEGRRDRLVARREALPPTSPPGCRFPPCCRHAAQRCCSEGPKIHNVLEDGPEHQVACHFLLNGSAPGPVELFGQIAYHFPLERNAK
jgi:ABC-type dipeptide/oligopeptide/nickel transport system ATPase component